MQVHRQIYPQTGFLREPSLDTDSTALYNGLSSVRFVSRVACEFECDTSKDNRSFATLPLSSTVHALLTVTQIGTQFMQYLKCVYVSLVVKMMDGLAIVTA